MISLSKNQYICIMYNNTIQQINMTENEIEINQAFIKKGIEMSLINADNMETGFISGQVCNRLDNQEMIEIVAALRSITQSIGELFEERNTIPNQVQSGLIFQFFFDRAVEIFFKQFNGIETDSVMFNVQDAFDYYEPDLPYNVQQILSNRVGNIAALTSKLWRVMENSGVFDTPFNVWFSNYLSVATTLGLRFAQEIDFDDESELNAFLNLD